MDQHIDLFALFPAGIDETISDIKMLCQDQQVPVAFPCQRRQLSYFLYKKASVSCVGVLDIDGVRDTFQKLIFALKEAKDIYKIRQESINML